MASYNRVVLLGNVTRDPELKYIPSGTAVCEIGLAVNDRRKDGNGEWVDDTTFVDITLWARTAEVVGEYVRKGDPLFVEGRLKFDQWEKDGQKRSKLRVVGERIQLLGGKRDNQPRGATASRPSRDEYSEPEPPREPPQTTDEGDIPF